MKNKTSSATNDVVFKLKVLAKEKEEVRKKLAVVAAKLKKSHQTLEKKVLKRTQDLERARAEDKALLQSIADGVVATNQVGKVILINKAASNLLELTDAQIIGKIFIHVIPQQDVQGNNIPDQLRPITLALNSDTVTIANNYYFVRKNGTRFPVAITVSPVKIERKIIGAIIVFRDITHDKQVEETKEKQLQHEIEMETKERDFISMASHQLLTPLTLMKGYTSMLISGKIGKIDQEAKKYLQESLQGSDRMSNLVKSLLTSSRIESENIKLIKINFDLDELMHSVIDELKPKLEDKKLTIKVPPAKKLPVFADKDQTREILINILDNAIKYSQTGTITVSQSQTDNLGTISVKDTGMGISQKDLPHIFEKFYVSENWLQKQGESHGLGLYIAKLFLKLMGGSIRVESQAGKGSNFFVSLPLTKND